MNPRHHRSALRVCIPRLAVSITLGALISVGLAWYLAIRPVQAGTFGHRIAVNIRPDADPSYRSSFKVSDEYRTGYRRIEVAQSLQPFNELVFRRISAELDQTDHTTQNKLAGFAPQRPRWFAWVPRPLPNGPAFTLASGRASGWPWLCVCSTRVQTVDDMQPRISGAVPLLPANWYRLSSSDPDLGALPLIPIWPGLLANTAIFSSPWLLLFFIIRFARRSLRRRRGLCTACAYDLRATPATSPCPECGANE